MTTRIFISYFLTLAIIQSCKESTTKFATKWTSDIKTKILEDVDKPIDSSFLDSTTSRLTLFSKGVRLKTYLFKSYPNDTAGSYFFSSDQNFKLVRELCPVIGRSFEAIDYKGNQVGLVEFRYCNGKLLEQGFRFEGDIGTWTEYDSTGNVFKTREAGDINKLENIRHIKYYR